MKEPEGLLSLRVVKEIAEHDQMAQGHLGHYFGVGLSGIWAFDTLLRCRDALLEAPRPVRTVLDFGCGCGRIGRFLRAAFPEARLHATDFRKKDVDWYVAHLDAEAAPDELPPDTYDLIWLGSVFTHLPEPAARELLARLLPSLADGGVLAFSTQGRHAYHRVRDASPQEAEKSPWLVYNLTVPQRQQLLDAYMRTGYGYVDYTGNAGYGVCIADAGWYSRAVFSLDDMTQIFQMERGIDDHQDVLAYMRRPVNGRRNMRFVRLGATLAG